MHSALWRLPFVRKCCSTITAARDAGERKRRGLLDRRRGLAVRLVSHLEAKMEGGGVGGDRGDSEDLRDQTLSHLFQEAYQFVSEVEEGRQPTAAECERHGAVLSECGEGSFAMQQIATVCQVQHL